MTKQDREAYRPAFEAWVDGELQIQEGMMGEWSDYQESKPLMFLLRPEYYRRKPKPMEVWVVCKARQPMLVPQLTCKAASDAILRLGMDGCRAVRFVEAP